MKKGLLFILLLGSAFTLKAQEVEFFKGTHAELLAKAKKSKKPFFIDFSTSWCGWCKVMDKKTFKNSEVGKYVNKNFLAYKVDAEVGEGRTLAKEYHVNSFPTLIIYDKDGGVLKKVIGYKDAETFLQILKHYEAEESTESVTPEINQEEYFKLKDVYMSSLAKTIKGDTDAALTVMLDQAYQYGVQRNNFEFEELKLDAKAKFKKDVSDKINVSYYLGVGDFTKLEEALMAGIEKGTLSSNEKHYFLYYLAKNKVATLNMLKAINALVIEDEAYEVLDTKALIQYLYGDKKDAIDTANKAKKIASKKKKDASATEALIAEMKK